MKKDGKFRMTLLLTMAIAGNLFATADYSANLGEKEEGPIEYNFQDRAGNGTKILTGECYHPGEWGWSGGPAEFSGVVTPGSDATRANAGMFRGTKQDPSGTGKPDPNWKATLSGKGKGRCWEVYNAVEATKPPRYQDSKFPICKTFLEPILGYEEKFTKYNVIAVETTGAQQLDCVITDLEAVPVGISKSKCHVEKSNKDGKIEVRIPYSPISISYCYSAEEEDSVTIDTNVDDKMFN